MSEFISGNYLTRDYDIKGFELCDLVKKGLLQPHHPDTGKPVPPPHVSKIKSTLKTWQLQLTRLHQDLDSWELLPNPSIIALEKEIEEIEASETKVRALEKEYSNVKNDSWKDYRPSSETEERQTIESLLSYLYRIEDVQQLLGPAKRPPLLDELYGGIMGKALTGPAPRPLSPESNKDSTNQEHPAPLPLKGKLRPSTNIKHQCQKVAATLWGKHGDQIRSTKEMARRAEIQAIAKKKSGGPYSTKKIQEWVSKVAPDYAKKPGIRPKY